MMRGRSEEAFVRGGRCLLPDRERVRGESAEDDEEEVVAEEEEEESPRSQLGLRILDQLTGKTGKKLFN